MSDRICSIEDCGNPHLARGWCDKHYQRWMKNGDPLVKTLRQPRLCSIEGCGDIHYAKTYCNLHYNRERRNGHPEVLVYGKAKGMTCSINGCVESVHCKSLCNMHYGRLRYAQSQGYEPNMTGSRLNAKNGTGSLTTGGYWRVRLEGRTMMEHRYVMEQALGRPLWPDENVHHINGDRLDNRLENLELWSTSQPSGQRIQDKVEWAEMILSRYGRLGSTPPMTA